jgi:hypothetical protein
LNFTPTATPLGRAIATEAFRHAPVTRHPFANVSGAFLVVRAALLGCRFCPARAAVSAPDFLVPLVVPILVSALLIGFALLWF